MDPHPCWCSLGGWEPVLSLGNQASFAQKSERIGCLCVIGHQISRCRRYSCDSPHHHRRSASFRSIDIQIHRRFLRLRTWNKGRSIVVDVLASGSDSKEAPFPSEQTNNIRTQSCDKPNKPCVRFGEPHRHNWYNRFPTIGSTSSTI